MLLLRSTAPYWCSYALFFIFLVTLTFSTAKMAVAGLVVAVAVKAFILMWAKNICCINHSYKINLIRSGNEYRHI